MVSVNVNRIKQLYQKYGSLEVAVSAKQKELEEATKMLHEVQDKVQREENKLRDLQQQASRLRAEMEMAGELKELGYDLPTLKMLVERTRDYGGVGTLLQHLVKHVDLSELERQIELRKGDLANLRKDVEREKAELNRLNQDIELKRFYASIE